ncbi:hypothetical protein Vi05172_g1183 [Venturia inaequalis]|nr:hypothetical protein Vi05172_g1183 [Venturia inaequalis]
MKTPTTALLLLNLFTSILALPSENSALLASYQIVDNTICAPVPYWCTAIGCRHNTCQANCGRNTPACCNSGLDAFTKATRILIFCP